MTRVLVVASLPSRCVVCGGKRRVQVVTGSRAGQTARCPHCIDLLPIAHLPMRTDQPRDAA